MSIESLKQQARRHEQNEEWQKALDQYLKAIDALGRDDLTDIGLINRVGDLYVRVGALNEAVKHYEKAADLYREAFLPNNAIAVCKKILRSIPDRHDAYLKMGQIRAEQGFLPDARTNFLTYAERMQQAGDLDESFRALVEFCDLAPDEIGVRITVADQMAANERTGEAVDQLLIAYSRLIQSGEADLATAVEKKIHHLDPSVDLDAVASAGQGEDRDEMEGFGELDFSEPAEAESEWDTTDEETAMDGVGDFEVTNSHEVDEVSESLEKTADYEVEDDDEEGVELPMMAFDEGEDEEEEVELPMMAFDVEEDEEEEVELPMMAFDVEEDEEEEVADLPTIALDEGGFGGDGSALVDEPEPESEVTETVEEAVEEATADVTAEVDEGQPGAFEPPTAFGAPVEAASPAPGPEASAAPDQPSDDYVDLAAMILGGAGEEEPKSTRFQVAYQEPSGDEEADFAQMLTQFKEKVAENLDVGDVRAHYDLGTAYREMGLLEEAISSFQQALRASADHLPTYEQMGKTFLEMGQPEAAVRTLERALSRSDVVEELVGIYYYLARAFEAMGDKPHALEYYDRVFALDINFADVTERLRELR